MQRSAGRLARSLICTAVLAAGLPHAAAADALADYLAIRDKAIAASLAAYMAGKGADETVIVQEQAAIKDLGRRMTALVGPVEVKTFGSPTFSLDGMVFTDEQATHQLEAVSLLNEEETAQVVVTPEPIFRSWLEARGKDVEAPEGFASGLAAAQATGYFYNNALVFHDDGFTPYMQLPVVAKEGEAVYATLGLFSDDLPGNTPPNNVTIVRIADGKAMVGIAEVKLDGETVAACEALWKTYQDKLDALQKAAEAERKADDPRWAQITATSDEADAAFRTCFIKEAKGQPFVDEATRKAEAFLDTMRGN